MNLTLSPGFVALSLLLCTSATPANEGSPVAEKRPAQSDAFFADSTVRVFDLRIAGTALSQLAQSPRTYVSAELREGKTVLANIGVRLKGESSFRTIEQKPSFSIKFDEFTEGQNYCGLKKVMFNNSVQDRTYLSELLATELFRDAGVPAARVTHARMRLNGRDLGLYVVVEAMNKDFLKRNFGSGKGNLYEAFLQDVNGRMEQDNGEDNSRADLRSLIDACLIADPIARWEQLTKVLDVERFVAFIGMEMLATHWDGYLFHYNNYRLYHDPTTDRMVFITHGLDSLFRRPDVAIEPPLTSVVANAVLTTAEGRKLYDQQFRKLTTEVFKVPVILERMDKALGKLRNAGLDRKELAKLEQHAAVMRDRIKLRAVRVDEQLRGIKPETVKFDSIGFGHPVSWREEPDRGEPVIDRPKYDGKETLHIRALRESTRASWRSQVFLEPGLYRFEGSARTELLNGGSARLRVSGGSSARGLTGTSGWQPLAHDFSVKRAGMDVELICELNAQQGEVWFDAASLRVKRIGEAPPEVEPIRQPALRTQPLPSSSVPRVPSPQR